MIRRDIRYQVAILQDHHVLPAQMRMPDGRTFWLPPGGGREGNESSVDAVRREILEETHLSMEVERLLFVEPEAEELPFPTIQQLAWFNLHDPEAWWDNTELGIPAQLWLDRLADMFKLK